MRISFSVGNRVVYDGIEYEIAASPRDSTSVLIKHLKTGACKPVKFHELSNVGGQAAADEWRPMEALSLKQLKVAEHRYSIIKPLFNIQGDREAVQKVADEQKVHISTIYRWMSLYNKFQTLAVLADGEGKGGKGKHRINDKTASVIRNTIDAMLLEGSTFKATYMEIEQQCKKRKYALPSENTVRNFFKSISEREKISRLRGPKAAQQLFNPVGFNEESIAPLYWCEMDHTEADIMCIDEETRKVIGKPWITVVIDVYSRAVLGFFCSFYEPGSYGTGRAVVHAMMPKESYLSSLGLAIDRWPMWGKMNNLRCDNAGEFKGNSIKLASQSYGIDFEFRVPGEPRMGAFIERWLGTFGERCKDVLGYTKISKELRSYFKPEKMATLTLADFEKWMTLMIIQYNNEVHSSLGVTPQEKFNYGLYNTTNPIGTPDRFTNEKRLRLDFLPHEKRTIQRTGVKIDNIFYYAPVLQKYINAKDPDNPKQKRKFIFKYDFRCIDPIYFLDPETDRYYEIPYSKKSGPKMSIVDLRKCIGHIQKNGKKVTQDLIFETFALQKKLIEDSKKTTKAVLRAATLRKAHEKENGKDQAVPKEPIIEATRVINPSPFISHSTNNQTEIKPFKVYDKRSFK